MIGSIALVGSIFQTGFADLQLTLGDGVPLIKHTMSRGKAKVLSKKPSRAFISIKCRVPFKAVHHYLDENAILSLPPCLPGPELACPSVDS